MDVWCPTSDVWFFSFLLSNSDAPLMHVSGVEIPGSRRGDFLSQWVEQEQGYCQNNSRKVVWLFWKWRYWPLRKVPLQKKRWILQNKYSSLCHFSFEFLQNNSWWHSQNIRVAALMMWFKKCDRYGVQIHIPGQLSSGLLHFAVVGY